MSASYSNVLPPRPGCSPWWGFAVTSMLGAVVWAVIAITIWRLL